MNYEMITAIIFLVVYVINFFLIISMIFLEKRDPRTILPWIFGFLLLPIISWVIYGFIGKGPKFNRRRWSKRKKIMDRLIVAQFLTGHLEHYVSNDHKINELIKLNDSNVQPCTSFNEVKIYTDAKEMYDEQLLDIKAAEKTINIQYYLFKPDEAGTRFLKALTEKAREGVYVLLVFDDSANPKTTRRYLREFTRAGGHAKPFFPSHFTLINHNFAYRNHRKIVVIDGKIGYVGGMNIGVDYLSMDKRIKPWRDTHMRIVGEAVSLLQTRFLQDYACADNKNDRKSELFQDLSSRSEHFFPEPIKTGSSPVQILSSGPDSSAEEIKQAYLKMIFLASKTLYLETPYFIPDKSFLDALLIAKKSGVDVNLVIPGVPDKKTVYHVTFSYLEELLKVGIKVFLYPGFIHAKMVVVDDKVVSIGTANLDVRSFFLNFEVNGLVYDKAVVDEAAQIALNDIARSKELTLEDYQNRSWSRKAKEAIYRLFAPLM